MPISNVKMRPLGDRNHWWLRYVTAMVLAGAAFFITDSVPVLREQTPFVVFFAAVTLSARWGGLGPALLCTAVSAIAVESHILVPRFGSFAARDLVLLAVFVLVSMVISSVSAQKSRAERAAEGAAKRLAAIVESSDDAIISETLDGVVTSWNRAAERIFGYTAEEIIGKSITLVIPPEQQATLFAMLARIRAGESVNHFQTERVRKDGSRIFVAISVSPIRDESGTIVGASAISRDMTAQRRAEEALRRTEKLAATGRLAATVAHEINNPLAAITNLLYLARSDLSLTKAVHDYLSLAEQELARVTHIAKQTLGFYREAAKPTEVDVKASVDELISIYTRKISNKDITVEKRYNGGLELRTFAGELRQVLSNLISNAIEALPERGGRLVIRVAEARKWSSPEIMGARIVIADNGCGIQKQHRDKVFEPFFTTKEVGTGLGLWVTHEIVQKLGGDIRVFSRANGEGSGTIFAVFIPNIKEEAASAS